MPTPWPAPGESGLLSAVCLRIHQGPLKRTEPLSSQPRGHGFKTRCTLRWVSCRLLYLEFKVDFLLHFSPALDLLCAWLPREQHRLRQCIPPRSLALLIVRPSIRLSFLLSLNSFLLVLPAGHFPNLHQKRCLPCWYLIISVSPYQRRDLLFLR